jgi:hypothetical protein
MEILDLAEVNVMAHAESGELEPLIKHIESGGALGPDLRKWLAEHLRGKHPKKNGNKRVWSQVEHEMKVLRHIRHIQREQWLYDTVNNYGLEYCREQLADMDKYLAFREENCKPISENRAKRIYLEAHPDMNENTLKTWLQKAKALERKRGW